MNTLWPRINTVLLLVTLLTVIGLFATRTFGGPLDPSGPPASTDGVRGPGTPISSLPFTITDPGYYYVTRHLTGPANTDGILIQTSNVTVDLGGFTLLGGANPGDGIFASGPRNIVIRNGAVRGWFTGINLQATYSRVERIQALSNQSTGIWVEGGSEVSACNASLNAIGVVVNSAAVRDCAVSENGSGIAAQVSSSLVEGNRVSANTNYGIYVVGSRHMVRDNQASGNVGNDVLIQAGSTYTVLTGNVYCTGVDNGTNTSAGIGNWC